MIPAHLLQQLRNIPVHEIIRALARWKEMASPIVGREGLEESIDTQVEAVPLLLSNGQLTINTLICTTKLCEGDRPRLCYH
jgi:hypothetical protein